MSTQTKTKTVLLTKFYSPNLNSLRSAMMSGHIILVYYFVKMIAIYDMRNFIATISWKSSQVTDIIFSLKPNETNNL